MNAKIVMPVIAQIFAVIIMYGFCQSLVFSAFMKIKARILKIEILIARPPYKESKLEMVMDIITSIIMLLLFLLLAWESHSPLLLIIIGTILILDLIVTIRTTITRKKNYFTGIRVRGGQFINFKFHNSILNVIFSPMTQKSIYMMPIVMFLFVIIWILLLALGL